MVEPLAGLFGALAVVVSTGAICQETISMYPTIFGLFCWHRKVSFSERIAQNS